MDVGDIPVLGVVACEDPGHPGGDAGGGEAVPDADAAARRKRLSDERGIAAPLPVLEAAGNDVTEAAAYAARPVERLDPELEALLADTPIDWVTVTSGVVAQTAARLFAGRLGGWRIASISPITSRVLEGLGFPPDCEAARPCGAALVEAMAVWESARRGVQEIHGGPESPPGPAS